MATETETTQAPSAILPVRFAGKAWPTARYHTSGSDHSFRVWHGTLEGLSEAEREALAARRLLIVWSKSYPGWHGITDSFNQQVLIKPCNYLGYSGVFNVGILTIVRPKSWEIIPPTPRWRGPGTQVRRRALEAWARWRHYISPSATPAERAQLVWPAAYVYALPESYEWVEATPLSQGGVYVDVAGRVHSSLHHATILGVDGVTYTAPWMAASRYNAMLLPVGKTIRTAEDLVMPSVRYHHPFTDTSTIRVRSTPTTVVRRAEVSYDPARTRL